MNDLIGEIWKPCPEFEGKYLISNYGRIKSIGTYHNCKTGELIKSYHKKGRNGYLQARLFDDGRAKTIEIHTLVAKAFVPNPNNLPMVNHRDKNKANNFYKNLEWCDNRYNIRYSLAKKIDVYTKDGVFVETLDAITDVANKYNVCTCNVSRCCKSKYGTCNGYQFRYYGKPYSPKPYTKYQYRKSRKGHSCNENRFIPINEYTTNGVFVKTWENISSAAKAHNTSSSNICKCYKGEILTNKGRIFLIDTNIQQRLSLLASRKHKSHSEL